MSKLSAWVVDLYEGELAGEWVKVQCWVDTDGRLRVTRTSRGELTAFCFGSGVHTIEAVVSPDGRRALERQFGAEDRRQLLGAMRLIWVGEDCFTLICDYLDTIGIAYRLMEYDSAA